MPLDQDILEGLALLPPQMGTRPARILLHSINLQENPTRLEQQVGGPARGDYQFERGGGVKGVMTHPASKRLGEEVCRARGVAFEVESIYQAIGRDPILAAALARLLIWTDPKPLPAAGDEQAAWDLYLRVWRPGAYARQPEELRAKFKRNYAAALKDVLS
ncbi:MULTISPECIES: hypothetical protein [unclassified Pseudomonas]|uniref:hypothetical protein n=1 Tax=unclassified Pseudomonas TaxID=196821 RepID=UPI0021BA71F8|nr:MULTISPECIES: hypothetical protein [unclassified Pseudomonas]MCT8165025.1 hypothetical protein [Pseudomonas sp. HD6422]MCT8183923.1 hypothetical protein [Pseudomonas sp. HD6421]